MTQCLKTKFNVRIILNEAETRLNRAGREDAKLAAEMLVSSILNCPRLELGLRAEKKLNAAQISKIRRDVSRLEKYEPIQYVLGTTGFMGYSFKCDQRALVPRPETEELVQMAADFKPLWQIDSPKIIDMGTGTGCFAVSLALLKQKGRFWAVDISPEAIELAKENARLLNALDSITFITADLNSDSLPSRMDAVAANPPYVRTADYFGLEKHIRLWEPRLALDGGVDGLEVIRPLVNKAFQMLKKRRWLFMEIGHDQWPAIERLLITSGFRQCAVRRDLAGRARMTIAEK